MGFRPYIGITCAKRGEVNLCRVSVAGAEPFGPPLPVIGEGESLYRTFVTPRALVHEGEPWVLHSGAVYRLDRVSNQWNREYRFADFSGGLTQRNITTGFHKVEISGIPHFVAAYNCASSNALMRGVKYNTRTRQWTESMTLNVGAVIVADGSTQSIMWKNRLYWYTDNNTGNSAVSYYNPITNAMTFIGTNGSNFLKSPLCIYKGRLFIGFINVTTNQIVEITDASTGIVRLSFSATAGGGADNQSRFALFTDGDYMYLIIGTNVGLKCYQILINSAGVFSSTDISSTVLPSPLYSTAAGTAHSYVFRQLLDSNDTSSPPRVYLLLALNSDGTPADSWDVWKWNGPSSRITKLSTAAIPAAVSTTDDTGDGSRNYIPGRPDVEVVSLENGGSSDVKINFRILESYLYPSGTPCSVSFLANINAEQTLNTVAVLRANSSTPDGSISNNVISGLTTGSGVLRSVIWRAGIQGAVPSGYQRVAGLVEIT